MNAGEQFPAHSAVDYVSGEYVRAGLPRSNTVENDFLILKRGIIGTFHHVSEAHLQRDLAELDFRYDTRVYLGFTDGMRADECSRP